MSNCFMTSVRATQTESTGAAILKVRSRLSSGRSIIRLKISIGMKRELKPPATPLTAADELACAAAIAGMNASANPQAHLCR